MKGLHGSKRVELFRHLAGIMQAGSMLQHPYCNTDLAASYENLDLQAHAWLLGCSGDVEKVMIGCGHRHKLGRYNTYPCRSRSSRETPRSGQMRRLEEVSQGLRHALPKHQVINLDSTPCDMSDFGGSHGRNRATTEQNAGKDKIDISKLLHLTGRPNSASRAMCAT
jgi:hypothetical protein